MTYDKVFILGVDGGGSQTRSIAADLSGRLLAKGTAGPSNPLTIGIEAAVEAIAGAIEEAAQQIGVSRFRMACLGVAGVERPYGRDALRQRLEALGLADGLLVVPDAATALAGATGGASGVVVVAGTGSIAYGANAAGETARAGGWGYIVGDEGSGYYIGRRAMTAAFKAYDGRGDQTTLVDRLRRELRLGDLSELIDHLYVKGMRPHVVAALAPMVAKAAEAGDRVAARIMRDAGAELGCAARAVIHRLRLQGEFSVAQTGGVFKLGGPLCKVFEEVVRQAAPMCSIKPSRFEPVVGAVLLALRELGVEVDEALLWRVEASLQAIGRWEG